MKEQIEEMARDLCECFDIDGTCFYDNKPCDFKCEEFTNAQYLYEKGYRKQKEGEWKQAYNNYPRYVCTNCNHLYNNKEYKYCPNCGAHMKGGAE